MEREKRKVQETGKKRRTGRGKMGVFMILLLLLGVCSGCASWIAYEIFETTTGPMPKTPEGAAEPSPTGTQLEKDRPGGEEEVQSSLDKKLASIEEKNKMVEELGTAYENVYVTTDDSLSCVAKKDGKWGMVSVTGEIIVPLKYDRVTFWDKTGWVEFQTKDTFVVYDETGKMIRMYDDKFEYRLESEEGILYRTAIAYMSGMEIKTYIPENPEDDFYGVEYYCRETGELLYRAVGSSEEVGVFTLPDETGRAVAISSNGFTVTIYLITKDGCESKKLPGTEAEKYRWISFPGDYTWADIALSDGWVKVYVRESAAILVWGETYTAFLNVDTLELVPFPEEYQGQFWIYDEGYRDAMAIQAGQGEEAGAYYAICKGNRKLTGENYYWVDFDEKYMMAGLANEVEILDYTGKIKTGYQHVSGQFVNGKMLVYDGTGVYFIDETLKKCSDYIVKGQIDYCFSRGIVVDGWYYLIPEFAE